MSFTKELDARLMLMSSEVNHVSKQVTSLDKQLNQLEELVLDVKNAKAGMTPMPRRHEPSVNAFTIDALWNRMKKYEDDREALLKENKGLRDLIEKQDQKIESLTRRVYRDMETVVTSHLTANGWETTEGKA